MTQINLNTVQVERLKPIKERGGYSSITAVIGALIAIYSDDLLKRVVLPPITLPTGDNAALIAPIPAHPITLSTGDNAAPIAPTAPPSPPKRTKFDL
jgi:hypothetical protein